MSYIKNFLNIILYKMMLQHGVDNEKHLLII